MTSNWFVSIDNLAKKISSFFFFVTVNVSSVTPCFTFASFFFLSALLYMQSSLQDWSEILSDYMNKIKKITTRRFIQTPCLNTQANMCARFLEIAWQCRFHRLLRHRQGRAVGQAIYKRDIRGKGKNHKTKRTDPIIKHVWNHDENTDCW